MVDIIFAKLRAFALFKREQEEQRAIRYRCDRISDFLCVFEGIGSGAVIVYFCFIVAAVCRVKGQLCSDVQPHRIGIRKLIARCRINRHADRIIGILHDISVVGIAIILQRHRFFVYVILFRTPVLQRDAGSVFIHIPRCRTYASIYLRIGLDLELIDICFVQRNKREQEEQRAVVYRCNRFSDFFCVFEGIGSGAVTVYFRFIVAAVCRVKGQLCSDVQPHRIGIRKLIARCRINRHADRIIGILHDISVVGIAIILQRHRFFVYVILFRTPVLQRDAGSVFIHIPRCRTYASIYLRIGLDLELIDIVCAKRGLRIRKYACWQKPQHHHEAEQERQESFSFHFSHPFSLGA